MWLLDMSSNPPLSLPPLSSSPLMMPKWGRVGSGWNKYTLSPGLEGSSFHQRVSGLDWMSFCGLAWYFPSTAWESICIWFYSQTNMLKKKEAVTIWNIASHDKLGWLFLKNICKQLFEKTNKKIRDKWSDAGRLRSAMLHLFHTFPTKARHSVMQPSQRFMSQLSSNHNYCVFVGHLHDSLWTCCSVTYRPVPNLSGQRVHPSS